MTALAGIFYLISLKEKERQRIKEISQSKKHLEELRIQRKTKKIERGLKSLEISGKIENFSGKDFEEMIAKIFSKIGYSVSITKGSGDQGIDLYMEDKQGRKVGVQCKKWKGMVGQSVIRDFYGSLMYGKLQKGFLITTGKFSMATKEFAKATSIPIILIDGEKLREILGKISENKIEEILI